MRFYGRIDEESTRCFNDEFLWVQDYIKPSKIIISINSEGGSVLYGMGTFAIIQQCPIEVETIIEGLALQWLQYYGLPAPVLICAIIPF